jgi:hypothetical protein
VPQNSPLCWFASALNQIWKTLPDPSSPPALDLCQLEDRLLYSASPLAILAADPVDIDSIETNSFESTRPDSFYFEPITQAADDSATANAVESVEESTSETPAIIAQAITAVDAVGSATARGGDVFTLNLTANETPVSWTINWGDGSIATIAGNETSAVHSYDAGFAGLTMNISISADDGSGLHFDNDLIVPTSFLTGEGLYRYSATTGAFAQMFGGVEITNPFQAIIGPAGLLYVTGYSSGNVVRYDPATGAVDSTFVSAGSGGLSGATSLAFGYDNNLYVSSEATDAVLRYNGTTGAFIDTFISSGTAGLNGPAGLVFHSDGHLYLGNHFGDNVLRFEGTTGAFVDQFVSTSSGGLDGPEVSVFGPDGNFYVANRGGDNVLRYNGTTGAFIDQFVTAGSGGLDEALGLAFGPNGNLFVSSRLTDKVIQYSGNTGALIGDYVTAGSGGLDGAMELTFVPNHQVFVTANTAPVLADTALTLTSMVEDAGAPVGAVGTLVSSLADLNPPLGGQDNVTDADAGAIAGIAIIATDTTNGSWFYSTDSGTAWNSLNAVSPTSSRVLLADGNTRVYFQPNADYQGAIANAITFRAWDQGDGSANGGAGIDASTNGGGTAFSSATDTVSITISNGNDAPVLDNSGTTSLTDINENDFDPTGDTVAALVATELPTLIRLRSRELL